MALGLVWAQVAILVRVSADLGVVFSLATDFDQIFATTLYIVLGICDTSDEDSSYSPSTRQHSPFTFGAYTNELFLKRHMVGRSE